MEIKILDKTSDYIICIKPAGLPVQTRSLITQDLTDILKEQLGGYIGIVHRLDQPVEGIMLIARNPASAAYYSRLFKDHTIDKRYLAEVSTPPFPSQNTLTDFLRKNSRSNLTEVVSEKEKDAQKAELSYVVRDDLDPSCRILEISLKTGRHHQIRVQLSHFGCPIVGDRKYGSGDLSSGLRLCSYSLSFIDRRSNPKSYQFLPDWIRK